jgi:hypothetical protein
MLSAWSSAWFLQGRLRVGDFTLMVYDDQIPFPARGMPALLTVNTVP